MIFNCFKITAMLILILILNSNEIRISSANWVYIRLVHHRFNLCDRVNCYGEAVIFRFLKYLPSAILDSKKSKSQMPLGSKSDGIK